MWLDKLNEWDIKSRRKYEFSQSGKICCARAYRIVRRETTMSFGSRSGSEFLENIMSLVNPVTRRKMCRMEIISLSANTREVVSDRKTTLFKSYIKILYTQISAKKTEHCYRKR